MSTEEFIDSLRQASRMLPRPRVGGDQGVRADAAYASMIESADLWLSKGSVEGFDPADFGDWPRADREKLAEEVGAFLAVAGRVGDKPAKKTQSEQARKHLENAIEVVRKHLLSEWLHAQKTMLEGVTSAARSNGWYVEQDEKEVFESLLGTYKAPRLRIKSRDKEVLLDPIALFCSGRQGVVDLVVMPTYETAYLITFKDGRWHIVSPNGTPNRRPLTPKTFLRTISGLPRP